MPLRINTNVAAFNTSRTLNGSTNALNKSLARLSSGLRINSAADDAAGLAIAEGFRASSRGSAVAQRNSQDGINFARTAEGALVETTNMIQRIRELAVQAANGTQSAANRTALQDEVTQLIAQIDDIASDTEFNGTNMLAAGTTTTIQSGYDSGQTIALTTTAGTSATLGISAINISTQAGASAAITTADTGLTNVANLRADLGAYMNRLEYTINNLATQEENAMASESAIRDADIARETMSFTRNQILVSAGTSMLAQANIVPQTALTLLG
jgi:flagellin